MTWELLFVLTLLVFALISFSLEKLPIDVTAIVVFAGLAGVAMLSGSELLPSESQLMSVFANSAPLTIAAMFVISSALEKCGAIDALGNAMSGLSKLSYPKFIIVFGLGVGSLAAFINNTPIVVIFMPVMLGLAKKMNIPASKLLIPLSYIAMFSGVCTLIGTSTNILVSSIIVENGLPAIGMFELTKLGVPLMIIGLVFLALCGDKLLPTRETLTSILSEEERREYITEAFVRQDSNLIGKAFTETDLRKRSGLRLVEVIRHGVALPGNPAEAALRSGDRLVLACRPSAITTAQNTDGLRLFHEQDGGDLEQIAAHEGEIVEGIIGPGSSLVGRTIREINFRQRFRTIVLAVHRRGQNLRDKLESLPLEQGDTLLLMGTDKAIENLRHSEEIILLDRPPIPSGDQHKKRPLVIGIVVAMVLSASFNLLPITVAAIMAVAALLLIGVIRAKDMYGSIEWRLLMLIYGMLALGLALQTSGIIEIASTFLADVSTRLPQDVRPYVMLALIYLITSVCTEFLSNNATAVLLAPLAIGLALAMNVDPRPFLVACCVAASSSFATPISYQTNTYVYGAGGYRFMDFVRIGIPLNIVFFVATVCLIPLMWSF